ncbi:MAG: hypothetical protein LWY06_09145, partial [Firmicutes bacterium]|nr:hypothetical protein [Bacillota bacterium]
TNLDDRHFLILIERIADICVNRNGYRPGIVSETQLNTGIKDMINDFPSGSSQVNILNMLDMLVETELLARIGVGSTDYTFRNDPIAEYLAVFYITNNTEHCKIRESKDCFVCAGSECGIRDYFDSILCRLNENIDISGYVSAVSSVFYYKSDKGELRSDWEKTFKDYYIRRLQKILQHRI